MYRFKAQAHQTINRLLPEPHAALLNGILLGLESGIPKSLYALFNATGSSHIIVISGSNISLLIIIFMTISIPFVGQRNANLIAMAAILPSCLMVGADASVVRAAIMGMIYVFARYQGQPYSTMTALFGVGFAMTLYNPLDLWNVGFQLSFAATLGLIVF